MNRPPSRTVGPTDDDGRDPHRTTGEPTPLDAETARVTAGLFGRDSVYVLLWGLQLALAALITPVATRLLSSNSYGRTMVAIAVMQVLVAIGSVSLQSAIQRQYQREDGPRQARRLVTLAIVMAAVTFAVADLTGPAWTSLLRLGPFHGAIQYAVAWASMTAITNAALGWIRSRDQLWMFGLVSVLASVGAGALSLALVVVVRRTAAEYVLGQLLAQAAAVLVALIAVRPLLIRLADLRLVRGALRYAGALVPAALAAFAMGAAARLIIQHDLGATAVARYAIAFNIGSVPMLLLNVLDISWMPRIFALPTGRIRRAVLSKSRDGVYTLLIPVVIGLSAGAPIVLAAWAPPDYHPDGLLIVVALLAGSALPLAGTMASTRVLLLTNRTVHVGTLTVIAATLAVALTVVLVPRLGLDGAALATFVGYSAQHVLLGLAARAVEPIARPRASLLAKCAVAGLAAALFTQLPIDAALTVIRALVAAVSLVVFAAVLCELVVPGRYPTASRLARRMHVIRSSA